MNTAQHRTEIIPAAIQATGIMYRYPGGTELHFADLELATGTQGLILGNSGSGKTTLLHILCGLLKPHTGTVRIDGQDLYALPSRELDHFRGRNIGVVFQEAHLVKSLTVSENLRIARQFAGLPADEARIHDVLASLALDAYAHRYPQQLSRGQVQRAAIARAVVNRPALLVADEPTSALDDDNAANVLKLLTEQASIQGATLLIATHDQRVKENISIQYRL